jgi:ATP-dependent 26S proteasome regulatory subunit
LREFTTKLPCKEVDLELNYGKEFAKKHEIILERLNKQNGSGLVVLNGKPGTGKTTYIKYLTTQIEKRIIFVPPSMAESLTGPNLLPFLMENKNSILIIEDAEKVIGCRESSDTNNSVSNILNMTDGILGDCLSLQVIATLNTPREKIDKALLRKGRLIAEHEFQELSEENVKKLFDKLKIKKEVTKPLTLTEIYNHDEDDQVTEPKKYIGFGFE